MAISDSHRANQDIMVEGEAGYFLARLNRVSIAQTLERFG